MQIYRIEVKPIQDTSDHRYVQAAHQLGLTGLRACSITRLFFLQGDIAQADAERLAADLLADPVTERYTLGASPVAEGVALVETTLLPGVTDPVAENLLRSAHQTGMDSLQRTAAGMRFELRGDLDAVALRRLATEVLSNPIIQRHMIGQPIDAPFVPYQAADDTVEVIPVRDCDDAALLDLSKARRLSLDLNEMRAIRDYYQEIERDPTDAELEMLAQTWSEHCVHKTFKAQITYTGPAHGAPPDSAPVTQQIDGILKTYLRAATEQVNKPWVRSAFVDNAGIIRFNEQWDVAFKVETHNRPSALEPFGGANTGVGGVIRDVLGVSARPIANTDILCFGPPDLPYESLPEGVLHPLRIADGVIHGIEDYGNKMGIPTVNGAIVYHKGYTSNPLVFCGCLGILPHGSHRSEAQPGDLIVVVGGRTGRDGLRGATFSSMEMDTQTATLSGGAVQIGHPIHEKQVQEVVLRARDEGLYTAITDCGAGGLSSAVGEMGERIGATVQLLDVPLKYPSLRPWEIWLSEAQERMVLAVPAEHWPRLQAIAAGFDIDAVRIGTFEPTGHLRLYYGETLVGDLSMHFLHDGIPQRHMTAVWSAPESPPATPSFPADEDFGATLLGLLALPTIRSKEPVIRRYDHEVQTGTAVKPLVGVRGTGPGDAAVLVPMDTVGVPLTPKSPLPQGGRGLKSVETALDGLQDTLRAPDHEKVESGVQDAEAFTSLKSETDSATNSFSAATSDVNSETEVERLYISPVLRARMTEIAQRLRRESTPSEHILWQAIRGRKLSGRKFRRQRPVGVFVLDFFCSSERLAIEVDGSIHDIQREADAERQAVLESLGIRFVRVTADQVEKELSSVLSLIEAAFLREPSQANVEQSPDHKQRSSQTANTTHKSQNPPLPRGERGQGVRGTPDPQSAESPGVRGTPGLQALALANGLAPFYTDHDPYAMAWAAVDEAMRNLVAVGTDPDQIAILDNFSWGNTQLPDRLGALVRCAQGCYDAAVAFGTPYISGKDSLNNEYLGADGERHAIPGTLVISALGMVPDVRDVVTMDLKRAGNLLYVIGETHDELGGSHYHLLHGIEGGTVPQPNQDAMRTFRALHEAIRDGLVQSCHDISEGGLAVALAEMCIAGGLSAMVNLHALHSDLPDAALLFSESPSRFVVEVHPADAEDFEAEFDGLPLYRLGEVRRDDKPRPLYVRRLQGEPGSEGYECRLISLPIEDLERAWRGHVMDAETAAREAAAPSVPSSTDRKRETVEVRTVSGRIGRPRVLILHANGTNRDRDAYLACEIAGGAPEIVHINQIIGGDRRLLDYHMIVVPGGFSYGDDLGAGVLWALDLRERLRDIDRFVEEGRPVLGICNGFQTLVKAGLIPGRDWEGSAGRSVTLTYNQRGGFVCRWVYLKPNPLSACLFTEGLNELIHCPVAHGEGCVAVRDQDTLDRLWGEGLAALTYVDENGDPAGYPCNPNGSAYNIAGLCNPSGNVFGLMPHPENHIFPWQHPRATRGEVGMSGLKLFKNGIRFA